MRTFPPVRQASIIPVDEQTKAASQELSWSTSLEAVLCRWNPSGWADIAATAGRRASWCIHQSDSTTLFETYDCGG